jgi:hypothetical protein
MIYKVILFLSIISFSFNAFSDERARGNNCYLALGFIEGKSKIAEFASNTGYDPSKLELFERKDKKIYFTLGVIDEDLYKSLKRQSLTTENMWCTSGKGYLKRYNLDEDYNLIVNNPKKFKLNSKDQFLNLINNEPIVAKKNTSQDNINIQKDNKNKEQIKQQIKSSYEVNFGNSQAGIALNESFKEVLDEKKYLEKKIKSGLDKNGRMRFGVRTYTSKNQTAYASFSFGIYKNENYSGYLKDLDGNKYLNPNHKHQIIALKPKEEGNKNWPIYRQDNRWIEKFYTALTNYNLFEPSIKSGFEKGLNELDNVFPSIKTDIISISWNPFLSKYISEDYHKGDKYTGSKASQWGDCFGNVSFENTLYILAPTACMEYVQLSYCTQCNNKYSYDFGKWSWENGRFTLIKEIDFLAEFTNSLNQRFDNFRNIAEEFKANPNDSHVTFELNKSNKKVCMVSQGDQNLDELMGLHVAYRLSNGDKSKIKAINSNKKVYSDLNSLYLEISQLKVDKCGILAMKLDDFSRLIKPMDSSVFKMTNKEIVDNFFTNTDTKSSFLLAYDGLTPEKVSMLKSITSMEVTPKNSQYFANLEAEFDKNKIALSKGNFELYKEVTNQIYGNTYLSNIISVLKFMKELENNGVDITNSDFQKSVVNNFNNGFLNDKNKIEIYRDLIVNLNMNINEIDSLFNTIELMNRENLYKYQSYYTYLGKLIEITNSDNGLKLKDYINGKLIDDKYALDEYIKKLSNEKNEREALAAKKARDKRERKRVAERERREKFSKEYPYKIRVTCEMNGSAINVGQCFIASGKYGNDGQISITEGNNSYEETAINLFRSNGFKWEKDIRTNSCYIGAQKSNVEYGKIILEVISNKSGSVIQRKSCSGPYCSVAVRC